MQQSINQHPPARANALPTARHFFYNSPQLDFLVTLQSFLTLAGNVAMWAAAYRIYAAAAAERRASG